jgi:asparagine synthase (glutamine-hydrolysing)
LSGGLDSSGIYALAKRYHNDVVPLILDRDGSSDGLAAKRLVSEIGGFPEVGTCPNEDELFDRVHDTIRIVESFEPNLVRQTSIQRHIAALAVRRGIKVILCGEGADELFCGYPDFWPSGDQWHALRIAFLRDLHRTQLQRVDRMSMWVTTEVRVPYLAVPVVALALANRRRHSFLDDTEAPAANKQLLRDALQDVLPEWARVRAKVVLSEGLAFGGIWTGGHAAVPQAAAEKARGAVEGAEGDAGVLRLLREHQAGGA